MNHPDTWNQWHGGRLAGLIEGGQRTAGVTLLYFQSAELNIQSKSDDSPVTVADRTAESDFRDFLSTHFPDDALLGEEHGTREGTTGYRWIVDPIDGTKSFIAGVPLYSTLVALEFEETPIAGGIWIPALGECVVAATDHGCWHRKNHQSGWIRTEVSDRDRLDKSIFVTTAVDSFNDVNAREVFERLQSSAWFTRTWGDGYGYLLVATGRADFMVDPIVSPWDVAAIRPVIEQAGGIFTDWNGTPTTKSTNAIGSNKMLHSQVLAAVKAG